MKNALLLVGMFFFAGSLIAQEKIGSYNMEYFSKDYEVMASEPDAKGDYSFYLIAHSSDDTSDNVSLIIDKKKIQDFKDFVESAKVVFSEWKETAKANNVVDVEKEIKTDKLAIQSGFTYGSEWHFDFNVMLNARFRVLDGNALLIIENKNKLQASDNRYIDSTGFLIVFNSVQEVDRFLKEVDPEKVSVYFASKKSKEDIFKQ